MNKPLLFFFFTIGILSALTTQAQFKFSGELRPRTQLRNGYRTLRTDATTPSVYISQRTRLNAFYQQGDQFSTMISFQDVRVWGDQDQLSDEPSIGLFEAWANIKLADPLRLKIGRQQLIYDDSYLLGSLNWKQTGRSHDAVVLQFQDSAFQAHLGLAYNQDQGNIFNTQYSGNYYKTLQFLWLKQNWDRLSASFILINRGLQRSDSTLATDLTFGPTIKYKEGPFSANAIFYYQTGNSINRNTVDAYFWSLKANYTLSRQWTLGVGADILSGTDLTSLDDPNYQKNNTFDILYGLRHGHFGFMDYFYLGFTPPAGLNDLMFNATYFADKSLSFSANLHSFSSNAELNTSQNDVSEFLGVEADLTFQKKLYDEVMLQGGYSHMFATNSMEIVKGGDHTLPAYWLWFQITITPTFFEWSPSDKKG